MQRQFLLLGTFISIGLLIRISAKKKQVNLDLTSKGGKPKT